MYSSLLHPDRRSYEPPSGRTSAVHHRIALFNSRYEIVQIISQTDIMRWVHENKASLQSVLKVKLMDVPGALSARTLLSLQQAAALASRH